MEALAFTYICYWFYTKGGSLIVRPDQSTGYDMIGRGTISGHDTLKVGTAAGVGVVEPLGSILLSSGG